MKFIISMETLLTLWRLTGFKEEYDIETTLMDLLRYWYDKMSV